MTQPNDPWAAATAGPAPSADASASSLSEGYAPEPGKQSSLFGPTFESFPSLFTQAHVPGTEFKGKITGAPRDVQSTCHPSKAPDKVSRLKEFWVTDPTTGKRAPGLAPVDPRTGKANDPVMNTVVTIQTDQRDPSVDGDDGRRSWFIQGSAKAPAGHKTGDPVASSKRAMLDAIILAGAAGISITKDEDLKDLTLSVRRVERVQPGVSTSPWKWQARITRD